jgi:UDP-glucose-4-epimerase GalE
VTKAVLVTGGAGYIGSHTCKSLARAGYLPVTIDNLTRGHKWAVRWGPLEEHDISDKKSVVRCLERHDIQAIIHFAAFAYVAESVQAPEKYFQNNVINTLNVLAAMLDVGVRTFIFSSSCAVYGSPESVPISESCPRRPLNPYGETKRVIENALQWYGCAHGLRSVALRYFNAAGADPDGEIGEAHEPETHLIPLAIRTALGQRSHLEINGTDYQTYDGTAIRDFVHVTDLADAHVRALKYLLAGGRSTVLNVGTGRGYSVREIIQAIERAAGMKVRTRSSPRRVGDPPVLIADSRKAKSTLGWEAPYSDLETIVETALSWEKSRLYRTHLPPTDSDTSHKTAEPANV